MSEIAQVQVNCSYGSPGIINNCMIMGRAFFQLDKISYVSEIDEIYEHNEEYTVFQFICDSNMFEVRHPVYYDNHSYEKENSHWVEVFKKFNTTLIDSIFDEETRNKLKEKKYI